MPHLRILVACCNCNYMFIHNLPWPGDSEETFRSLSHDAICSGGLRKGWAPVQIKWGGPFLYTSLYHDLSALAIKRNNAFHK